MKRKQGYRSWSGEKTQAGKDTQNSGKSTAQDDGSTAGPPVIWNRKMPEDVVLPASYDYREQDVHLRSAIRDLLALAGRLLL